MWHAGQEQINAPSITSATAGSLKWAFTMVKAKAKSANRLRKTKFNNKTINAHNLRVDRYAANLKSKRL